MIVISLWEPQLGLRLHLILWWGWGVSGKPRSGRDPGGPWAVGRNGTADPGGDGKNRTGQFPRGPSTAQGQRSRPGPQGSRVRKVGNTSGGPPGQRATPAEGAGKGAGLLPGGPFCARAHLHGRELSAAGLALAALIPLLPTCSPEIRTQLQTQIKESLPHKSGRPAVGTRPGLHLLDLGEGRGGETQAGTDLERDRKGSQMRTGGLP